MSLMIIIQTADGETLRTRLHAGRNRITVRVGDTYRIIDDTTQASPKGMVVRQLDSSLWIDGLAGDADPPVVELAGFYTLCSAATPCQLLVVAEAGGASVVINPGTPSIGALADGTFVLHDPNYVAPLAPSTTDSASTLRYGLYGLGGLAVLGLAGGGGGGGGGDSDVSSGPNAPPPDGTLKLLSGDYNSRQPVLHGEGQPGARIIARLDINGDGVVDVTYSTTVGDDFLWRIDLATARPDSGTLPAGGLPDRILIGISSSTAEGVVSLAPVAGRYDDIAPPAPVIDPVSGDGQINGAERLAGIMVTGSAEAGATVLLTWGDASRSVVANDSGRWQATFQANALPADGTSALSAVARDSAGNASPATRIDVSIDTRAPALAVSSVAGPDGVLTLADGNALRLTGLADAGSTIAARWNGVDRSATANGAGEWVIEYSGAELPVLDGIAVGYSIVATNLAGNVSNVAGAVLVDRVAPAAPLFNPVEADNRVSLAERADGVVVSGSAEANSTVEVGWGAAVQRTVADASGVWRTSFAAGDLPAVASPGAATTLTARAVDVAGNVGSPTALSVYVEQPFAPPTIAVVAADDVVNAAERGVGVLLSGTVAPGGPGVAVSWGGFSAGASVAGGSWQLFVPAASVPADGSSVVTAAILGFPAVAVSRPVSIDTTAPGAPVIAAVTGDNLVTPAERAGGITVTGTAEAGTRLNVSWGTALLPASAGAAGEWAVTFSPGQIPTVAAGVVTTQVSAVAIDAAGNTGLTGNQAVQVVVPYAAPTVATIALDDVINAAERDAGVLVRGTVTAGVEGVYVQLGSFAGMATVTGNQWAITVPGGAVPADGVWQVTATIPGAAGGAAASHAVRIDTTAPGAPLIDPVTGDNSIDFFEGLGGFVISGRGEAGSTVQVSIGAIERTAIVDGGGAWITTPIVLTGLGSVLVTASLTDGAGNGGPASQVAVDFLAPGSAIGPLLDEMRSLQA